MGLRYTEPVGRREAWLANVLMMIGGVLVFLATIAIFVAGILNFPPP